MRSPVGIERSQPIVWLTLRALGKSYDSAENCGQSVCFAAIHPPADVVQCFRHRQVDAAVGAGLDAMLARATADGVHRIAMPSVGAGKGGIDPVRVKRVLSEAGGKTPISLVVFEQFVRRKAV